MTSPRRERCLAPRNAVLFAKLARAEDYVRDVLRIMGQDVDAANPVMVTRLALQVMSALDQQTNVDRLAR